MHKLHQLLNLPEDCGLPGDMSICRVKFLSYNSQKWLGRAVLGLDKARGKLVSVEHLLPDQSGNSDVYLFIIYIIFR